MALAAVLSLLALAACGEGDSDDVRAVHASLIDFGSSQCLLGRDGDGGVSRGAASDDDVGSCVDFRYADGLLELEVPAVRALCLEDELLAEIPWQAEVDAPSTSELEVRVVWPSENTPACGGCLYDFSFALEMDRIEPPLDLTVEVRSCPSCPPETRRVALRPTGEDTPQSACVDDD